MLAKELAVHLQRKILPFWMNLADEARGGYYGYVNNALEVDQDYFKGCILNSRILWTFATAARITGDEACLYHARRAYDYLQKFEDPACGGVYWSVTPEGLPLDTTKHTYCQAFTVYGLAAYVRACGDRQALEKAMALFRLMEGPCSDEGGYREAFNADWTPAGNEKLSDNPKLMEKGETADRTMNTLLHVLEAYAELYRAGHDEDVRKAGMRCLERFLHVMYNQPAGRLEVFYDAGYRSLLDMQSYGHDIEASWLMWDAVETLIPQEERAPYRDMCLTLAKAVYARAYTDHGVNNEVVEGEVDTLRVWWVQAEALLGFDNAWRLGAGKQFRQAAENQWQVIQQHFVDKRPEGGWFSYTDEAGEVLDRPMVDEWICPYHSGRMCLRMMELDG